jgi:hypothetical protein
MKAEARCQWLTPVILASQEAEIRRITVRSQPGQIVLGDPISKIPTTYLYTMEFYAAMKKNEILSFAGKWMELENIILSEVSLAQKTKNRMFSLICGH